MDSRFDPEKGTNETKGNHEKSLYTATDIFFLFFLFLLYSRSKSKLAFGKNTSPKRIKRIKTSKNPFGTSLKIQKKKKIKKANEKIKMSSSE